MKAMKTLALLATVALASRASAQPAAPGGAAPASGFRAEYARQLDDVEKKIVSLAEAIPAEKYSWRPGDGVRSISEVLMHVAGGNYFLMTFAGAKAPEGLNQGMEKSVTEKAKVVAMLKDSFAHVRKTMQSKTDADLEKPVTMFGRQTSIRDVFFSAANHMHEHMGQTIAYARSNGIVPPWNAKSPDAKKES